MTHKIGIRFKFRNIMTLALCIIMFCPAFINKSSAYDQTDQSGSYPRTSDHEQVESLLWKMASSGLPGTHPTMRPFMSNFTDTGPNYIIVGTDKGLAVISATNGSVKVNFNTFESVVDIIVTGDLSGDNQRDLVAVVLDQGHPNIFAIASSDGRQLWSFNPTILGFNKETLLQQNYTTFSWDIESVEDLNGDSIQDVVLSSWFRIYALDGASGLQIWANTESCTDDIWKITIFPDINQDNHDEIAAGSHKGEVVLLNGQTGQEIWPYTIPEVELTFPLGFETTTRKYSVPVSDMKVGPDIDNDMVPDLIVTGDDGIFRVLSGRSGFQLSIAVIYPNATVSDEIWSSFQGTWYSYRERLFTKSGAKIYPMPDMDGDGGSDWMVYAYNLERSEMSPSKNSIFGTFLNVKNTTLGNNVSIIVVGNWSVYAELGDASAPCLLTIAGQKRLYYHTTTPVSSISAGLFYYVYNKAGLPTGNPTVVAEIEDRDADPDSPTSESAHRQSYLINIGDITGDGVSDLFGFSRQDTYYTFDANAGEIIWIRHIQGYSPSLIAMDDLNGDGAQDFLYSSQSPFSPEWGVASIENDLNLDACAINGLTGSVIWRLQLPSIYEGIMDIQNIGDLSGDGHVDFAGWIIPTYVPQEIKNYIFQKTGADFISNEGIYRALLANYTRLIVIDGLTGGFLDSQPLSQTPYRFYRTSSTSLEQNHYYNRINGEAPGSWFTSEVDRKSYNWAAWWEPSILRHANLMQIQTGLAHTGSVQDTWDNDNVNYTLEADYVENQYQTIVDCDITVDLSENKSIGTMEYPLSELERVSALKIQSQLRVNRSDNPLFYNVTYSIYNVTSGSWVSLNWTSSAQGWVSGSNAFPELYGSWNSSYRTSNKDFTLATSEYRTDAMYVCMRGTNDKDTAMKFDYENKTSLAHFVNPGTKTVLLRVNVTNTLHPFNLSIDSLGIVAMAWGLAPGKYDQTYTWNYRTSLFVGTELIDIQVQDFQVINGTGDNFLDILAITGYPTVTTNGGVSIRLFDLKNNNVFTKWTTNTTKLPYYKVRAQVMSISLLNNWILTGAYTSGNPNYMSKLVLDPHWNSAITCFDNFTDAFVTIDFGSTWDSGKNAGSIGDVEVNFFFPTVMPLIKNGTNGLMIFYEQSKPLGYSIYGEFRILNATTFGNLGIIPCQVKTSGVNYRNLLHSGEAQVLLAEDDFDGDGFIDHAGVTEEDTFEPYMGTVTEKTVRIYSGNVAGGSEPVILNETVISRTHSYFYGETVLTEEEKYMPCASIGDTDGDGASELAIGLEAPTSMYSGDKGSSVIYVNLNKGIKTEYIFDPYISLFSSYPFGGATEIQKDCYERMANVGSLPQKSNLVFVERSKYKKGDYFGYSAYPVSEILDLISHQTVLQLQVDVDSIDALPDLTGDGINEYLISSGGILYCYNSEFKVTFSNLLEGEIKTTNTFTVEWSSPALQPMYQLIVNNTAQVLTSSTSDLVSLGSGWKHIQVLLYDTAGIFVSVDDVTIFIPESNTMIIVTVIIVVGLVVVQILRKKRKASIKRKYDIVADKSSSTTAPQYQTNGKAGERSWNPKG